MRDESPSGPKHTMLTAPAIEAAARDISHEKMSLLHHFFDHSLNPLLRYCSPSVNLPPLPECPITNLSTCRTHPIKAKMLHKITAPGPRLPRTALIIRLDPTSMAPIPQRPTGAGPVPTLHSLSSVGLLRSRTKGHGTAWSSLGGQACKSSRGIKSKPLR